MSERLQRHPRKNKELKRTVTNAEAYRLHQTLGQMKSLVSEPRLVYALIVARKKLQPLAEAIDEMMKPSERIQCYERLRQSLCQENALKNESGQPMISPEQHFVIDPQNRMLFEHKLKGLQSNYQSDIDKYQEMMKNINAFMLEISDIEGLPTLPLSAIRNAISIEHMEALFPIVHDDSLDAL